MRLLATHYPTPPLASFLFGLGFCAVGLLILRYRVRLNRAFLASRQAYREELAAPKWVTMMLAPRLLDRVIPAFVLVWALLATFGGAFSAVVGLARLL
jgi:uncharacterized protein (DUF58 family)